MKITLNIEIDISAEEVLELKNGYEKQAEAHRPDPPCDFTVWSGRKVRYVGSASDEVPLDETVEYKVVADNGDRIRVDGVGHWFDKKSFILLN